MKQELDPTIDLIRKQLDAAVEGFDDQTRNRLRAIRRSALSAARGSHRSRLFASLQGFGMPARIAAATGTVLLALLVVSQGPLHNDRPAAIDVDPMASMDLLASAPDVEFYRNLEFVIWYAQTQHGQ
jgi:hypothetical protein